MPRRKKDPAYRRQREKNRPDRALVVIDGRRYHLGEYDDEESRRRYHELLAQWRAGELHPDDVDGDVPADLTIVELCARWQTHARTWYRLPDGTLSREAENFNPILKLLRENFGRLPVAEFRPKQFRVLRSLLIEQKNARTYINAQMRRVRQIVRWGVGQDLVDVRVLAKIETVEPLKRGRTEGVRETKPVKPVTIEDVEAVRPHVSRQVWAAIELQLLTGARPGEILKMRPCDIDTSAEVWFYAPDGHKNTHRGHERKIPIGPKAQAIIRPFLADRALTSPLLSPKEAEEERLAKANAERKTPLSCGNRPGTNRVRKPKRAPGKQYGERAYRYAITRACKRAGIDAWSPNQLRHTKGTLVRKDFGIEASRVVLGHRRLEVTEIYAEQDFEKAVEIARKHG